MNRAKHRILLVDDEKHLLLALGDFLEMEGFAVGRAVNGEDALKEIARNEPDLIVLDIRMPKMGGIHFLKLISDEKGRPKYPVLIATAMSEMEDFFSTLDVDGFVSKPYDEEKLLSMIRQILSGINHPPAETPVAAPQKKKRILLAEDDQVMARSIEKDLAAMELSVSIERVNNGPEAIAKAFAGKHDMLLIKEVLSGMNGCTVAKYIKREPGMRNTPVLIYDTTRNTEEMKILRDRLPEGTALFLASPTGPDFCNAVKNSLNGFV